MGESDEDQVKQQQEKSHSQAEQTYQGGKLPVFFQAEEQVEKTAGQECPENDNKKQFWQSHQVRSDPPKNIHDKMDVTLKFHTVSFFPTDFFC